MPSINGNLYYFYYLMLKSITYISFFVNIVLILCLYTYSKNINRTEYLCYFKVEISGELR